MIGMARNAGKIKCFTLSLLRFNHGLAQPAPLETAMGQAAASRFVLPEFDRPTDSIQESEIGFDFSGSMELMAVPKKKVSPHKRGIRNGPKALKPVPVIVRCKVCGRVKLPHFFCCSGIRETPEGQNGSTS